jgi:hypothetical protein
MMSAMVSHPPLFRNLLPKKKKGQQAGISPAQCLTSLYLLHPVEHLKGS